MNDLILFHGTRGSNILSIMRSGQINPGSDHKIYFSRFDAEDVLSYGADIAMGASFV